MIVCIFSFNRGQFLAHCVESIERCAPRWQICVMDDDSDDSRTLNVLEQLRIKHRVINGKEVTGRKHGGLYTNMQTALETFASEDLILFLQDDMQMVRPLLAEDEEFIRQYFQTDASAGFLQPCFLKGSTRERDRKTLRYNPEQQLYTRENTYQSAGVHYSDILLASPANLLAADWHFAESEPENDRQAARLFGKLGHLFAPFAMWLPEVPAYRGKRKTLALKIAEKRRQCGLYPFDYMSDNEVKKLRERSPSVLPVAEDFLHNTVSGLEQPWVYYPLQGSRWLKKLNSLEMALRRIAGF